MEKHRLPETAENFSFGSGRAYADNAEYASKGLTFDVLAIAREAGRGYDGKDRWALTVKAADRDREILTLGCNPKRDEELANGPSAPRTRRHDHEQTAASFWQCVLPRGWRPLTAKGRDLPASALPWYLNYGKDTKAPPRRSTLAAPRTSRSSTSCRAARSSRSRTPRTSSRACAKAYRSRARRPSTASRRRRSCDSAARRCARPRAAITQRSAATICSVAGRAGSRRPDRSRPSAARASHRPSRETRCGAGRISLRPATILSCARSQDEDSRCVGPRDSVPYRSGRARTPRRPRNPFL